MFKLLYYDPTNFYLYYLIGLSFFKNENQLDQARSFLRLSIIHQPKHIDSYLELSILYHKIDTYFAIKLLEKASLIDPNDKRVLNTLAIYYADSNRYEDAEKLLLECQTTGDNDSNGNGNSDSNRPHARPYLGITVQYTTTCYPGKEEHGLEVLTVDPNSPASQAGLQPRSGLTAVGAALTTLSGILPGGSILATKALGSTGAEGQGGDLIVAIDDQRVRDQSDLESAMYRLKPGDTMYLTVIRPQGSGDHVPHSTMKINVQVGEVGEPIANAAPGVGDGITH